MAFYLYLRIFLGQVRIFCKLKLLLGSFCLTSDTLYSTSNAFATRNGVILFQTFCLCIMVWGGDANEYGNIY